MNQIRCGDTVIDTDDVQLAIKIEGEDAQKRVFLRGGRTAILRGEEEVAFDVWAATLPRAGMRAGERQEGEQDDDVHGWTPPPEARRLCTTCRWHDPAVNGCRYPRRPKPEKPECYGVEEVLKANKPLCETCACYEAESGHCTEFAGNHYPECWVARIEAADCKLCRHYRSCEYCMRGKEREWSGCFETREEEPETKPPQKAKVLLLSHIWECSKCGEVLATDVDGKPVSMADSQCVEIVINGEARLYSDGLPLVKCWQCQMMNLWPAELRERVAKGTAEEDIDDRTG